MNSSTLLSKLSPGITKMIRADHSHVMLIFHRFNAEASPQKKHAIIKSACLALTIHAQLEEEIFYPALAAADSGNAVLAKSKPEHDEMRRLIAELDESEPGDPASDELFMQLMREVLHHVADEETVLLPAAERLLADRLQELGAQMSKRRMELAAPHAGELLKEQARAMPTATVLVAGGLIAGAYLLGRGLERRH
jgi:hemerythrin superfamily protein